MKVFRFTQLLALGGCLLASGLLVGCGNMQADRSQTITGANLPPKEMLPLAQNISTNANSAEVIKPGDAITIIFSDLPPNSLLPAEFKDRVKDDGTLTLPLNVKVKAAGKTPTQLQEDIYNQYVPRYFVRLTINVKTEDRFYYVGGFVRNPGRFPYLNELSVLRAVESAGGVTEYGDLRKITLTRGTTKQTTKINGKKAQKDPSLDVPVYSGDYVYVEKRTW